VRLGGLLYTLFPQAAATRLATWQFWLQNISVPVFIVGLLLVSGGIEKAVPVVIAGSLLTLASLLAFLVNVFANVRAATV